MKDAHIRINQLVENEKIVNVDIIDGKVKDPLTGLYIGHRFEKPYYRCSHGYSPENFKNYLEIYRMLK